MPYRPLIVAVGDDRSASLAGLLSREGTAVELAAHNIGKLDAIGRETGARAFPRDATNSTE